MKRSVALVFIALWLSSCAARGTADLSGTNPALSPSQKEDVATMTFLVRKAGVDVVANLIDVDGNGKLDLTFTSPNPLPNPDKDLAAIAEGAGMFMPGAGYPVDLVVVYAGPEAWTADFDDIAACGMLGDAPKSECTVEKVWKKGKPGQGA